MSPGPRHVLACLLVLACAVPATAVAQDDFDATVRRSAHGIPHISGKDFGDLGYGYGYAFAQDNICVIADQYVTVSGERSKFFGPAESWQFRSNGTTNRNLESDFFFKRIIAQRTVEKLIDQPVPNGPRPEVRDGVRGYVAGYNRYLRETGVANLPDPACRGKDWVRPITEMDVYRRFYQLALLASGAVAINGIGGAQPPAPGDTGGPPPPVQQAAEQLAQVLPPLDIGSNAYGIGREQTDNGKGLLLGNPHFPWDGSERFYQSHLTIPGKVDVQGGSLFGVPIVLIGNTRGLAWSHTVSTAFRFTPFELTLAPGSPTTYLVDGVPKQMTRTELTVETPTGPVKRTLYDTEYGPVFTELLGQPLFPWTQGRAYAMGDANAANFRYLNHFFETNMAQTVREYDAVLRRNQGIPWVNSIAADATGEAYYADISVVPHVTNEQADRCNTALGRATTRLLRLPVLDGARAACNWGRDPSAIQPGTFGPAEHLPSMFRTDYTMNANDSYWLGNLKQRLEGFPLIVGDERTARSLRTRIGLLMVDGQRFTQQGLMDTVFNNRQYAGELWRDEAVAMCRQTPGAERACPVLAAWNVRDDLDSRGALLFRRFAQRLLGLQGGAPFRVPFDVNDPANTPRGLRTEDPRVRQALVETVRELDGLEIPLDAPLGDVQNEVRGEERLPIHGGPGTAGVFNALNVSTADLKRRTGYETVPHGSSYVQVVQFVDGACPVEPRTILTYSQSTNALSPFFSDQTRLYGRKQWVDMPFCEDEVARATLSTLQLRSSAESGAGAGAAPLSCRQPLALRRSSVIGGTRRARIIWGGSGRVSVELFRVSSPRAVLGNRRVARYRARSGVRTLPRRAPDGVYVVRFRASDVQRRIAVRRSGGRWRLLRQYDVSATCGPVRRAKLERPVFGGRDNRALGVAFRLAEQADVELVVRRGSRVVRRVRSARRRAGVTHRVRIASERLRRGTYTFELTARGATGTTRTVLTATRL
jgi:acyl-homoserine-lactone acylase